MTDQELIETLNQKFINVSDLARQKNAHLTSVYGAIRQGRLTAIKILGMTVIPMDQAVAWNLKRNTQGRTRR